MGKPSINGTFSIAIPVSHYQRVIGPSGPRGNELVVSLGDAADAHMVSDS